MYFSFSKLFLPGILVTVMKKLTSTTSTHSHPDPSVDYFSQHMKWPSAKKASYAKVKQIVSYVIKVQNTSTAIWYLKFSCSLPNRIINIITEINIILHLQKCSFITCTPSGRRAANSFHWWMKELLSAYSKTKHEEGNAVLVGGGRTCGGDCLDFTVFIELKNLKDKRHFRNNKC